jgi:ribose transport system permease protein
MNILASLSRKPWIWSFVAAFVVWIATILFTGGASTIGLSQAALTFAAFSILVGIGQMFVITLGPGNIDLCVPATMTLAGTVALKFMQVDNTLILPGLVVAIAIGVAVGIGNYALIKLLQIPPIIATLSMSFIVQSTAIWTNRGLRIKPPEVLAKFTTDSTLGMPERCSRCPDPLGSRFHPVAKDGLRPLDRSDRPEHPGGPDGRYPRRWHALSSPTSSVLFWRAICGYLLASFSGGAALNMGSEYLLMSIAVVVIGGTAVAGGNSNVAGIWGASLFMFLVVSMLNTYGAGAGIRLIMTGLIIIAVIVVAGGRNPNQR